MVRIYPVFVHEFRKVETHLYQFFFFRYSQKCDGAKPACQQCTKAKKGDGCEYDDGKGKTRTQLMREHIARLESRIKELETSEQTSPPITLFDPHVTSPYFSESSSSSSHDSPGAFSLSTSASPVPFLGAPSPSFHPTDRLISSSRFRWSGMGRAMGKPECMFPTSQQLVYMLTLVSAIQGVRLESDRRCIHS